MKPKRAYAVKLDLPKDWWLPNKIKKRFTSKHKKELLLCFIQLCKINSVRQAVYNFSKAQQLLRKSVLRPC